MIHLTTAGTSCSADLDALTRQFEQRHSFRLPQLLDPDLMQMVAARLEVSTWMTNDHERIGREMVPDNRGLGLLLNFVANAPQFIELIRRITQCDAIVRFEGRVYRMVPNSDNYDSWHSDANGRRHVGMSINLGSRPYRGGVFQLRKQSSTEVLCELPNLGIGDAIVFRVASDLTHMVSPVEGTDPRTAFAGWFQSGEDDFFTAIRRTSQANV